MERGLGAGQADLNGFQIQDQTGIYIFDLNYGWLFCLDFSPGTLIFVLAVNPTNTFYTCFKKSDCNLELLETKYRFRCTARMAL